MVLVHHPSTTGCQPHTDPPLNSYTICVSSWQSTICLLVTIRTSLKRTTHICYGIGPSSTDSSAIHSQPHTVPALHLYTIYYNYLNKVSRLVNCNLKLSVLAGVNNGRLPQYVQAILCGDELSFGCYNEIDNTLVTGHQQVQLKHVIGVLH